MTFAQAMADQLAHDHDENIRRIRAQAKNRAERRGITDAKVIRAFQDRASAARSHLDPEPALQKAWTELEAA